MASIAISELDTSVTSLSEGDLILVSKKNGSTYTSAKMTSENLKTSIKSSIVSTDLPIASTTSRGTVKVGTGLTIDSSTGTLNATGTSVTIDNTMSITSTNPVQNKVITAALNEKASTSIATTSANGLMSSSDKTKLDGIAAGATKITVDSELSSTSTNPVQNKVITATIGNINSVLDSINGEAI